MLFVAKDLDIWLILVCTKSVTMQDIVIVADNDISVHCSFSESGPIVGNFHRALVSRLSSGHRCLLVVFFQFCLNCFFSGLLLSFRVVFLPELCFFSGFSLSCSCRTVLRHN